MSRLIKSIILLALVFGCSPVFAQESTGGEEPAVGGEDIEAPTPADVMREFAKRLDQDWKDKPEWAEMASSFLKGELMGVGKGWYKASQMRLGFDWLKEKFDKDGNGKILKKEISSKFKSFVRLDRNNDGELTASDLDWSDYDPLRPERSPSSQLFFMLDADTNGKVTKDELGRMFGYLDQTRRGFLTSDDFQQMFDLLEQRKKQGESMESAQAFANARRAQQMIPTYLHMLFTDQLGHLEDGPKVGEMAPDFELPYLKGKGEGKIKLSDFRGKQIVVLNFGSFT